MVDRGVGLFTADEILGFIGDEAVENLHTWRDRADIRRKLRPGSQNSARRIFTAGPFIRGAVAPKEGRVQVTALTRGVTGAIFEA